MKLKAKSTKVRTAIRYSPPSEQVLQDDCGRSVTRSRQRMLLIRYENATGDGLFSELSWFKDWISDRQIRCPRKTARRILDLIHTLYAIVEPALALAYKDHRCRHPITWFLATASEPLRIADELVRHLNRYGADIRRIETDRPEAILWQDDIQVVTRSPRRPRERGWSALSIRHVDRRKRLEKIRRRAGRIKARRMKSGI